VHRQEGTVMVKHSDERSFSKHTTRLFALLLLSVGATTLLSDVVFAQQNYRALPRRAVTPINPPQQTDTATGALAILLRSIRHQHWVKLLRPAIKMRRHKTPSGFRD